MAWISVHQDVDGTKLRRLYQAIGCSKFEALGILNFLWFWGLKNADENGLVRDASLDVLNRYLYGCGENSDLDMRKVVQALVDVGWVDLADNGFVLHDWDTWQSQWYKYQRTKEYNAERMRKTRSAEKARKAQQEAPEAPVPPEEQEPAPAPKEGSEGDKPKPKTRKKAPKKEPDGKKYAEFVTMTEAEYDKLVQRFGAPFTLACIEKLDNYKGSNGKSYQSDYRAILNWVIERVKQERPGLLNTSLEADGAPNDGNPYGEWGEEHG